MRTFLMYRDRDFNPHQDLPWNAEELTQDLELKTLMQAMARDDPFLYDVVRTALLLAHGNDPDTVQYRQAILQDCIRNPKVVRDIYQLATETIERKGNRWLGIYSRFPSGILRESIQLLEMMTNSLRKLNGIVKSQSHRFQSEGFCNLFSMLDREITDEYLSEINSRLNELKFPKGLLLSSKLGEGNLSVGYVLRHENKRNTNLLQRMFGLDRPPSFTFRLNPHDESGAQILSEIQDSGVNLVANALAQSTDHVNNFFANLRTELAFYVACVNLYESLVAKGEPVCIPHPVGMGERKLRFKELYDPCLSLSLGDRRAVANSMNADGKTLVLITGANQGGKSVFLRSIGLAQIMMQSGMFVAAESFEAELYSGIWTHYKREEDASLENGKFDEELHRMSEIVDHYTPHAILLCNESFAATCDREGSEIARQIVSALLESHIKVIYVTHLYEFATGMHAKMNEEMLFLRAEREEDGTRTFKLFEGEPLQTAYGEDLYQEIFSET
jgi:DNA mismatch repair ATPase MutS